MFKRLKEFFVVFIHFRLTEFSLYTICGINFYKNYSRFYYRNKRYYKNKK